MLDNLDDRARIYDLVKPFPTLYFYLFFLRNYYPASFPGLPVVFGVMREKSRRPGRFYIMIWCGRLPIPWEFTSLLKLRACVRVPGRPEVWSCAKLYIKSDYSFRLLAALAVLQTVTTFSNQLFCQRLLFFFFFFLKLPQGLCTLWTRIHSINSGLYTVLYWSLIAHVLLVHTTLYYVQCSCF